MGKALDNLTYESNSQAMRVPATSQFRAVQALWTLHEPEVDLPEVPIRRGSRLDSSRRSLQCTFWPHCGGSYQIRRPCGVWR